MAFCLPTANTHSEVAKDQHLVPRTYMRMWSYNQSDSIWVLDKTHLEKGFHSQSVENINYKKGFHDIKAGDVFVPDEALQDLFGFMNGWTVESGGKTLSTEREFNDDFHNFDKWIIKNEKNEVATKKDKNEIKRIIDQSRYTFIETEWCNQFENGWQSFINNLEMKLRCNVLAEPYHITKYERDKIIEYILIGYFYEIS